MGSERDKLIKPILEQIHDLQEKIDNETNERKKAVMIKVIQEMADKIKDVNEQLQNF